MRRRYTARTSDRLLGVSEQARFVRPTLARLFVLVDAESPARGDVVGGPFSSEDVIFESDDAMVLYEYGSLPLRFGVLFHEGAVLHLHPSGRLRVVAVDEDARDRLAAQ